MNITDFMARSSSEETDGDLLDDDDSEHYVNVIVDHAVRKTLTLEEIAEASVVFRYSISTTSEKHFFRVMGKNRRN